MKTTHTPGPWHVHVRTQKEGGCGPGVWVEGANHQTVMDTGAYDVYPLREPDRRLLEAAPDLLSVARVALTWHEHPAVHDAFRGDELLYERLNDAITLARAALAKAEGRPCS